MRGATENKPKEYVNRDCVGADACVRGAYNGQERRRESWKQEAQGTGELNYDTSGMSLLERKFKKKSTANGGKLSR